MPIFDKMREVAAKRREEEEKQRLALEAAIQAQEAAIIAEQKRIIDRNSAFFQQIMSIFQQNTTGQFSWITQQETYRSNNNRIVFIGFENIHIYNCSTPPKANFKTPELIWPEEYFISFHDHKRYDYTKLTLSFPDHFSYAPISDYLNYSTKIRFTQEEVLEVVANEIHNQLTQNFPTFTVSDIHSTKQEYETRCDMYFYFEYTAPYKELSCW